MLLRQSLFFILATVAYTAPLPDNSIFQKLCEVLTGTVLCCTNISSTGVACKPEFIVPRESTSYSAFRSVLT